jgi:hypothetical protein
MGAVVVAKFLCKAKVDDVDEVRALAGAHDKVGGLDIAMDEVVRMNEFNTGKLVAQFSAQLAGFYGVKKKGDKPIGRREARRF